MLTVQKIKTLLQEVNDALAAQDVRGEIGLCGGAAMCLAFRARAATKDIDGIFAPTAVIRKAARAIATRHGLPEDWLNDAAKGYFLGNPPQQNVLELSHLRVWAPVPDYLLAMKCVSARFDTHDQDDIRFLLQHLQLRTPQQVFAIIEHYYPRRQIPAKTQFVIEELCEKM